MIIEIESFESENLIYGKEINYVELQRIVKELLELVEEKDFLPSFCLRYGYEIISNDEILKVDFVIDLDTHMVIIPKY